MVFTWIHELMRVITKSMRDEQCDVLSGIVLKEHSRG